MGKNRSRNGQVYMEGSLETLVWGSLKNNVLLKKTGLGKGTGFF